LLRLKNKMVTAFRDTHHHRVICSFARIVLGEFEAQAFGLNADARVGLRVETRAAAEHFGGDLIFLQQFIGMFEGLLRAILQ
jgi:hypothetical protein